MTEMTDSGRTSGPDATPPRSFADMNLDPAIQQALDEMGYEVPMEVQTAVYSRMLAGCDLMVQSRTGSGKTAAFGIPIAQILPAGSPGVQALILAPTRELALQVSKELGKICAYRNLQVVPVYGGAPMGRQIEALKAGAQIVCGTPGRVLDHIRRGTLRTEQIRLLVLDECDEMLSMGFQEEIEKILAELPAKDKRQTLLFSATIPEEIERIGRRHMRDYEKVLLSTGFVGVHEIHHEYYLVSGLSRTRDLLRVIEYEKPESAIIFCNTREDTALVASFLQRHGYDAEAISGDLTQADRERVMARTRDKNLRFMCATDIAARGIDISDLTHVINYTFPESPEVYIHRTGRTGRAGKTGTAISLIGPREIGSFYYLKLLYKIKPEERELPTEAELRTRREGERYSKIVQAVPEEPSEEWRSLARRMWQSSEGERVVATLLQRVLEGAPSPSAPRETAAAPKVTETVAVAGGVVPSREPGEREPKAARTGTSRSSRDPGEQGARGERRGRGERAPRGRDTKGARGRSSEPGKRGERAGRPSTEGEGAAPPPAGEEREFWEAWVDEKSRSTLPASPGETGAPSPQSVASDTPPPGTARAGRPGRSVRSRTPREELAPEEPGYARVYVNVGKREGLKSDDIGRLVIEAYPDVAPHLTRIHVMGTHSYVSVKEDQADAMIAALKGHRIGEREVTAERARK